MSALTLPGSVTSTSLSLLTPLALIPLITGIVGLSNDTVSATITSSPTIPITPFSNATVLPFGTAVLTHNVTVAQNYTAEYSVQISTVTVIHTKTASPIYSEIDPFTTYIILTDNLPVPRVPVPLTTTFIPTVTDVVTSKVCTLQLMTIFESVSGTVIPVTIVTMVDGHLPFPTANATALRNGTLNEIGFASATATVTGQSDSPHGFLQYNASSSSRFAMSTISAVTAVAFIIFAFS